MRASIAALLLATAALAPAVAESVDLVALEASLEAAERAFAQTAANRDRQAFESFLTAETVFSTPHGNLRGPEAILEQWAGFSAPDGPVITWEPERVAALEDGSLGLSTGLFRIETRDRDGQPLRLTGTFFSVWRRTASGEWKILLDTGTQARPADSAAEPGAD